MKNQDILDSDFNSNSDNALTDRDGFYLRSAGKWAKFLAIVSFVILGLMAIMLVVSGSAGLYALSFLDIGVLQGLGGFIMFFFVIILVVYFAVAYFFLNFGTKIQHGINAKDTASVTEGFKHLKNAFIIVGILSGLQALFSLIGLVGTLFS